MSFETEKRKFNTSVQNGTTNTNKTEDLIKYNLNDKPENVLKQTRTIHLIQKYDFPFSIRHNPFDARVTVLAIPTLDSYNLYPTDNLRILVDLPNFPSWMVPFTKIIPKMYVDDAYNIQETYTISYCNTLWNLVGPHNYKLYIDLWATAQITYSEYISTYLDLDLVLINDNCWQEFNYNKM